MNRFITDDANRIQCLLQPQIETIGDQGSYILIDILSFLT